MGIKADIEYNVLSIDALVESPIRDKHKQSRSISVKLFY